MKLKEKKGTTNIHVTYNMFLEHLNVFVDSVW